MVLSGEDVASEFKKSGLFDGDLADVSGVIQTCLTLKFAGLANSKSNGKQLSDKNPIHQGVNPSLRALQ